jgi:hypothetical protein
MNEKQVERLADNHKRARWGISPNHSREWKKFFSRQRRDSRMNVDYLLEQGLRRDNMNFRIYAAPR